MLGLLLTVLLPGVPPLVAVAGRLALAAVAGREALGATGARNELAGLCIVTAAAVLDVDVAAGTAEELKSWHDCLFNSAYRLLVSDLG